MNYYFPFVLHSSAFWHHFWNNLLWYFSKQLLQGYCKFCFQTQNRIKVIFFNNRDFLQLFHMPMLLTHY